ncbi:hypothetical protein ADIMK_3382 [Marinobacterium lacunae]|uniref:Uncharacterized protein n=1 Tax=Marinobacterium lacunae TaxID=1232683 RepID=A0A081FVD6_9GAMM|nr:hypothetical protein ADIMK_3382 [Marinobacterium lacunae]
MKQLKFQPVTNTPRDLSNFKEVMAFLAEVSDQLKSSVPEDLNLYSASGA